MKIQATVNLNFPSEKRLKIVLGALGPETRISPTSRSRVQAEGEGNSLTLIFEARDTSALRAALNSYLRLIVVINDACSAMETIEKQKS
jgi:tRNA threonylcarbamoyladenosine modification (KEOPS) complex  Pcc1 subunit